MSMLFKSCNEYCNRTSRARLENNTIIVVLDTRLFARLLRLFVGGGRNTLYRGTILHVSDKSTLSRLVCKNPRVDSKGPPRRRLFKNNLSFKQRIFRNLLYWFLSIYGHNTE